MILLPPLERHHGLVRAYDIVESFSDSIGRLFEMGPLTGVVEHSLKIPMVLLHLVVNVITLNQNPLVTCDTIVNEFYFLAGNAGDMFRQFQTPDPLTNLTCVDQNTTLCFLADGTENLIGLIPKTLDWIAC